MTHLLDNPLITQGVFFPRQATMQTEPPDGQHDGTISIDDIVLGYRLFIYAPDAPLVLFFHGNGEVASDYNGIARLYHDIGLSLLVVDYRGYGWSTGRPKITTMLPDAGHALHAVPAICAEAGINADVPLFVMGRSLGSAPAIYVAHEYPDKLKGLIVESGYADAPSVFKRLGVLIPDSMMNNVALPISNERKMARITLPLLLIHGTNDEVLPYPNGEKLYAASTHPDKRMVSIHGAGHNDLFIYGRDAYFNALAAFVAAHR